MWPCRDSTVTSDLLPEQVGDRGEEGDRQNRRLFMRQFEELLDSGEGTEVGGGKGDASMVCCCSQTNPTEGHRKLCLLPLKV